LALLLPQLRELLERLAVFLNELGDGHRTAAADLLHHIIGSCRHALFVIEHDTFKVLSKKRDYLLSLIDIADPFLG
jgi:hypothetical protein